MMRRRFASIICEAASRVLPSSRRQWGDAMIADLGYVDDDDEALPYATGCLLAAFVERFRDFGDFDLLVEIEGRSLRADNERRSFEKSALGHFCE